jgi:hypothetical protein
MAAVEDGNDGSGTVKPQALRLPIRTASNFAPVVCSKPASNELLAMFTKDLWKSSVARDSWRLMRDDFASLTVEHPDCQLETTHPVLQYYPSVLRQKVEPMAGIGHSSSDCEPNMPNFAVESSMLSGC